MHPRGVGHRGSLQADGHSGRCDVIKRLFSRARTLGGSQQLSLFGEDRAPQSRSADAGPRPLQRRAETKTRFVVLGSGSAGNSILVEGPKGSVLIDAGFSCRNIGQRMQAVGAELRSVGAVLLTHEHGDHCRGVRQLFKRFRPRLYGTPRTFHGAAVRRLAHTEVELDRPLEVAGLQVTAFPVPHDARSPVGYVLEDPSGARLGVATDLGCVTQRAWRSLLDLDALVLESNHDPHLLETGPYPFALKRRVASRTGHLSNDDAAATVATLLSERLHTVVPFHLSRTNNRAEIAENVMVQALAAEGAQGVDVVVSDQVTPSRWIDLAGAAESADGQSMESRPLDGHCLELA